jgi:hypothetical protein
MYIHIYIYIYPSISYVQICKCVYLARCQAKGKFNLFGFNIALDLVIGKTQFKFYAACDPLKFAGGLITLARSKTNTAQGPLIDVPAII